MNTEYIRVERAGLEQFCRTIFHTLRLTEDDAEIAAKVLVSADAFGIASHGVGRLWRYVNGLKTGLMVPNAEVEHLIDTSSSLVVDAHGAMGAPVSVKTMNAIIKKAKTHGAAFGCVRDSNHFGIAGYYARMALKEDMLGITMTNTAALGVPTFGRQVMFGTNPLAFAAPADREHAFVLDMSTTVVARGKLELFARMEKHLPVGWAVDKTGQAAQAPEPVLADMQQRLGGGILPLGGLGKEFGGHKGYGLAVMVDILCAVLGGSAFGPEVYDTEVSSARVSHFFGAIKISCFRDPAEFRQDMDRMLQGLRETPPAEGEEQVYFAGQQELRLERESWERGVPILRKTYDGLCEIGREFGLQPPSCVHD